MDRPRRLEEIYSSREDVEYRNVEYIIENAHRPIVIAGNGPSLAHVDNRRIPENALIFRINNFFFEDRYFLGRNIDYLYIAGAGNVVKDYINTLLTVLHRKEYSVNIYMGRKDRIGFVNKRFFPCVDISQTFVNNKPIADFMTRVEISPSPEPTSGMLAIFAAISFGYKEIYLTGVDLYAGKEMYNFQISENHSRMVGIDAEDAGYIQNYHSREIDIEALMLAKGMEGVTLRSLSPESPINEYLELGEIIRDARAAIEDKQDYVKDFIPVSHSYAYRHVYDRHRDLGYPSLIRAYLTLLRSPMFSRRWYKRRHQDVSRSGMDPAYHFLIYGCAEGRNPGPDFDTRKYYARNPDVADAGLNALVHYVRYGRREGRDLA